jgi:HAD superfamily hydrolase (TIGR01509 family)
MVKCVVFDLDGTLVDIGELFGRVFTTFLNRQCLPAIGFDRRGDPWASAYDAVVGRFRWLARLVGGKVVGDAWGDVLREMLGRNEVRLYHGALDTLKALRAAEKKMCLATNTPKRFVEIKLDAFGLREFFECVFTPQDEWGGKPSPRSLHYAMKKLGLSPQELVMVGDHAQDVQYGRNAGIRTAVVLSGYGSPDELKAARPDFVLSNVGEVARVVTETERR